MRLHKIILSLILATSSAVLNAAGFEVFAYRSFKPSLNHIKTFADYGVNTVAIFPANTFNAKGDPYSEYPPNWLFYDTYNFDIVDKQLDDVLSVNKNANFIFIVDLNSPMWLYHHLATCGLSMESDSYTMLSNTVANKRWKDTTKKYLKALLEHVEKKYPDKIKAYLLACGMTDEWMDYSKFSAGPSKINAYKAWLKKRGKEYTGLPQMDLFNKASFENFLRDPGKESNLIDYAQFSGELVADTIDEFAQLARATVSPEKKIGAFFGYIMQLDVGRLVSCGHLSYEKIFASKNLDSFQSPGTYDDRKMGQGSGFMCADGTRKRYGKGWLHEIDHFTIMCDPKVNKNIPFKGTPGDNAMWKTPEATDAGIKRELSLSIVNGASLWFFDMWGGFFDTKEIMSTIAAGHKIWKESLSKENKPVAEIALVADPQSALLINDSNPRTKEIFTYTRRKASLIGAPFEIISFNDLDKCDLSKYKFFIFPAAFKIDQARRKILEKNVFVDGKTSLFIYAPAITDGKKLDKNFVKDFTGFEYGSKGLNLANKKNYNIAYVHSYGDVTAQMLRKLAEDAGVKMYIDFHAPVYANSSYAAIHTAEGGLKRVSLPAKYSKIVEKFTGKVVGENTDSFQYNFASPDTALFELIK